MNTADLLKRLEYIADSPAREHGGFHEETITTAKAAIEYVERHEALLAAAKEVVEQIQSSGGFCNPAASSICTACAIMLASAEKAIAACEEQDG